ncbi:MAG: hypothetical protein ACK559_21700, partial [bacterium]
VLQVPRIAVVGVVAETDGDGPGISPRVGAGVLGPQHAEIVLRKVALEAVDEGRAEPEAHVEVDGARRIVAEGVGTAEVVTVPGGVGGGVDPREGALVVGDKELGALLVRNVLAHAFQVQGDLEPVVRP